MRHLSIDCIQELLSKNEYENLDFKQIYWEDNVSMVHDILCMANSLVPGNRYIIFGVEDETKKLIGIPENTNGIKSKQQITDCLSKSGINAVPSFEIHSTEHEGIRVYVLVMAEPSFRPYYSMKDKTSGKKTIRSGVVYTRDNDTNTPLDSTASPEKLTQLWSYRFGLNKTPIERFREYLIDVNGWEENEENNWYYRRFPEFTIQPISEVEEINFAESWVRAAINPNSYYYDVAGKYHQTILWKEVIIYYDEMRYQIPKPELKWVTKTHNNKKTTYFYSYTADSFKFLLVNFFSGVENNIPLEEEIYFPQCEIDMPLIVFLDNNERINFINYLSENPKMLDHYNDELINNNITEQDAKVIKFCYKVKELYKQWKKG
jgi:Putative DNA-binding domain